MANRYMALWFKTLKTDWLTLRQPELAQHPIVFTLTEQNRVIVSALNSAATSLGLAAGMRLADAKAMVSDLRVFEDKAGRELRLLTGIGHWCARYSPCVALDAPDGLLLDISGCCHLWGGERSYYLEVVGKLQSKGYQVRAAIADTAGAAWGIARFAAVHPIAPPGNSRSAVSLLPSAALRLEDMTLERLYKLGFHTVASLLDLPSSSLRRRFGDELPRRLGQATGDITEHLIWLAPPTEWQERLPCLEPISTRTAIDIAIQRLLGSLCVRLSSAGLGIRRACLTAYRLDGQTQQVQIGTNRATFHTGHLVKLFEQKIGTIEPDLGIELLVLEAPMTELVEQRQEALWAEKKGLQQHTLAELLDKLGGKIGAQAIRRYLPREQHWPERAIRPVTDLHEKSSASWRTDLLRPVRLLPEPEPIRVSALLPDSPPMIFRYHGHVHHVRHAEGPERIEREWWRDSGEHRDYYAVEDTQGQRYWLFRLGHYHQQSEQWFIHGFFS